MSSDVFPKSIWAGTFTICGVDLRCHVLDTGQRIIECDSMDRFMEMLADGAPLGDDPGLAELMHWQRGLS